jgi:hypothetical protein
MTKDNNDRSRIGNFRELLSGKFQLILERSKQRKKEKKKKSEKQSETKKGDPNTNGTVFGVKIRGN